MSDLNADFHTTLIRYLETTSKDITVALNTKMRNLLIRWYALIPVADRAKIQADLMRIKYIASKRVYKSGKIRLVKQKTGQAAAFGIMNAERKTKGLEPLHGEEARQEVVKFIARRLKAVGSLKGGLRGALRTFGAMEKTTPVKASGSGKLAVPSFNTAALAVYNLNVNKGGSLEIDPRVIGALEQAMRIVMADMEGYLASKMKESAQKHGIKTS